MREPLRLPHTREYDVEDAKSALRQTIREHRRSRPEGEVARLGTEFAANALTAIGSARSVALYVSRGAEPDTSALRGELRARDIGVLLPVLGPGLARQWAWYQGEEDLGERAPGRPPEPSGPVVEAEAIRSVDVVITPGLAVDGFGTRLGQGGGWYDRMLKLIDPDVPTFAMVYDEELVSTQALPSDQYDVPIQAVITPTQVFLIEGSWLAGETREAVGR